MRGCYLSAVTAGVHSSGRPDLHIIFTLDCPAAGPKAPPYGPAGWGASAWSIDAYCTTLLRAGHLPTVFMSPEAGEQHAPMCEDLAAAGVEVALLVQPPALSGARLRHYLGAYPAPEQEAVIGESRRRLEDALGHRVLSIRSARYSASDATYGVLNGMGFRQASLSSPGRRIPKHHVDWSGAAEGPHFASRTSRLHSGDLPLLEVPVSTDPTQRNGGVAPDLAIENGSVVHWHAPLIDVVLSRQEAARDPFRALTFVSSTGFPYADATSRQRETLADLVEHLETLEARFTIVPATLSGAYVYYRTTIEATPA